MKSRLVAFGVVICTWWAMIAQAQELRYLGPSPGTPFGRIAIGPDQVQEVSVGTEIPGWGQVTTIAETHLVVRQRLSEAEQDRLRNQGMAAYDALELHIPRADLGAQPMPPPR